MTLTEELVLPGDVRIVPVAELAEATRAELGDEVGFAVTRPLGRSTSALVDDAVADLLAEFREPSTVAAAVIRYSERNSLDPQETLVQAYPALRHCAHEGFLVASASVGADQIAPTLAPGDEVAGFTVAGCLHLLDDTEVYRVQGPSGPAALKRARNGVANEERVRRALVTEAAVLARLGGSVAPELLVDASAAEEPYLVMQWCDGVPATAAPSGDRLGLFLKVVEAYRTLHAAGIRHGDVHPGNVLVDGSGVVRLIDFGLAVGDGLDPAPRGGVAGFHEPEFAAAQLEHREPPAVSMSGEIYALAVLGYLLLTGTHYLDLGLDAAAALRRIVDDEPLPFSRRGARARPAVEQVLRDALAKDPARRPVSMAAFAEALVAAAAQDRPVGGVVGSDGPDVLRSVLPGGVVYQRGPAAPTSSITYGAAGIALGVLRIATLRGDADLFALADEWAERGLRTAASPQAFLEPSLNITEQVVGAVTPYHRLSGVHLARALVARASDNTIAFQQAVDAFLDASTDPCANLDLTLGRSGSLLGATLLLESGADLDYVDLARLRTFGAATLTEIWAELDRFGRIADCTEFPDLGVAHGWAGVLLATLRWTAASSGVLPSELPARLAQLADLAMVTGRGVRWPWANAHGRGAGKSVDGWCNGTAGQLFLWVQAHRSLDDQRWIDVADRAGAELLAVGGGLAQLCCGSTGQGYALLELYRHTGEQRWLHGARRCHDLALDALESDDLIAGSLFKGELSVATLAADLEQPELAAMPAFGLEGW